jgi:hypothetical protein
MEKYVFITFVVLFFQGITFWFTSDMFNYRCDYQNESARGGEDGLDTDWWTGAAKVANSTSFFNINCKSIHIFDRSILMMEAVSSGGGGGDDWW